MIKISRDIKNLNIRKIFSGANLSLIYIISFGFILLGSIMFGSFYHSGNIREGDISLRTVYAPYDFKYPSDIDKGKTKEAKDRISKRVPLVFYIDNSVEDSAIENLTIFFDGLSDLVDVDKQNKKEIINEFKAKSNIDLPDNVIMYFAQKSSKEAIRIGVIDIITSIYPLGIVDPDDIEEDFRDVTFVKIMDERIATERIRPVEDVLKKEDAKKICKEYASRIFSDDARLKNYATDLTNTLIEPNMTFNSEETEISREQALGNVPPVYHMVDVKKNELILERGQRIAEKHIEQLMRLGIIGGATRRGPYLLGMMLLITLLIVISMLWLFIVERKLLTMPKEIAITLINCLFIILLGQFVIQSPQSNYIIPLSGISMLIALLVSSNAALVTTVSISIFLGIIAGGKIEVMFVLLIGGFTALYLVRGARRRSNIIVAGLIAGLASAVAIIAMGLLNNLEPQIYFVDSLWGFGSSILSIFLVMGALPLFEYTFKMTTNITLLELSDLNYPLLKALTLKAPGTYQHSIMVGNLAESACDAIGANALLARVGAYYHDIGKIEKAEYFSENEMGAMSKHEKLTPSMSALIIVNHVKDGVELAKKHNLNTKIIEFIEQHHGTGLIYYFYRRALERVEHDHELKEEEFRYPGPKPQTKETAIVLLADSVEASSRALSDPTPARIRGLVQKVMNNKFIDNQLDKCELTLKDLNKIAASFVRVLTAVFHTRLEYPESKNITAKKSNGKNKSQQPKQK